jgi:hypothetical protein
MSTRTDIAGGLLLPREQPKESKPWYDFSGLPEWDFALPGGPQDAAYQLSELRADMTPGEGQLRSAKRSAAETAKATELFGQGKYLEAIPPSIWAGVEGLDAAASGLGVIGAAATLPLDAARGVKRLMTASAKKQEAIINHGVRNLPTLRKAINQSRKEKHLIPDRSKGADGQFVGAPRGIKSKTQIKKMRAEFDAQVAGGVLGADWYQRVRKFTGDISGGSKKAENRLSESFALFSAQSNPDTNMNWTFQALNNYAATKGITFPEKIKTGAQARTFLKGMLSDQQIKLGKKTQVYHDSLNPNVKTPITGTNDIWHGRAFGYKNNDGKPFSRGFTPQEHVFLDNETVLAVDRANKRKLGGRSNWNAAEVQAAAWVYAKGKSQFTKYPNKFNGNIDEAIEWAKKTYPEYIDKYSVFGTREDIPGMDTGHLPGVTGADLETRIDFANDVPGNLGTSTDVITDAVGGYSTGLRDATGVFTSHTGVTEVNPAQANQMFVDLVNDEGGKTISDVSQSMMNSVEGIHGYINMQNGSAWHKFIPFQKGGGVKSAASNSIQIQTGAPLDESRMRDLAGWADERGMILSDNGKSVVLWPDEWGSKPALSSAGEEVIPAGGFPDGAKMRRLVEGKKASKTREAAGGWQEELTGILQVDKSKVERGRVVSGYVDYEGSNKISNSAPENAGRGLRTKTVLDLLDDPNIPAVLENIDNSPDFRQLIHDQISRATDWSKKMKTPLREDHMRALEILAEEGFKGLRKALKSGAVLPAVALPIFGAAFQVQQEQEAVPGA